MKKLGCMLLAIVVVHFSMGQNIFITRNGQISFFSKTSMENIDAINNEVSSVLNNQNGEIVFSVLIKGFHFQRSLMEEHFNENYMESDNFPKSVFKGKITSLASVNFSKDGSYSVAVEGELTIHGVTQKVNFPGTINITNGKIAALSKFKIKLADYNIKVPSLVADKISKLIDVTINCIYEPKK
jgi:hypothetical protein